MNECSNRDRATARNCLADYYADKPIKPVALRTATLQLGVNVRRRTRPQSQSANRQILQHAHQDRQHHDDLREVKKLRARIKRLREEGHASKANRLARLLFQKKCARRLAARYALRRYKARAGETLPSIDNIVRDVGNPEVQTERIYLRATPKEDGSLRATCEFQPLDSARQRLFALAFGPLVEFHETQAGVPGRGINHALEQVRRLVKTDRYTYGAEVDITSFFQNIDTTALARVLGVKNQFLKDMITYTPIGTRTAYLRGYAWRRRDEVCNMVQHGLPQGSAASPIFAYSLLKPVLDALLEEHGEEVAVQNYCDNFLILGPTREAVQSTIETLIRLLGEHPAGEFVIKPDYQIRPLSRGVPFLKHVVRKRRGSAIISLGENRKRKLTPRVTEEWEADSYARKMRYSLPSMQQAPQDQRKLIGQAIRTLRRHEQGSAITFFYQAAVKKNPSPKQLRDNLFGEPIVRRRPTIRRWRTADKMLSVPDDFKISDAKNRVRERKRLAQLRQLHIEPMS